MVKFRIGHSGITWGFTKAEAEQAVKDVAELGYSAYETFGHILVQYQQEEPGGFGAVLERYGIPLAAAYCPTQFVDPSEADEDVDNVTTWARVAQSLGATAIVLQATRRQKEPYTQWQGMAEVFNEIGRRARDMGMVTAIHPHTGTLIETRAEIDAILYAVDPDLVGFAPDTGQIEKGGADAVATLRAHKALLRHIHLKDYGGGVATGYAGYVPVGSGVMDMGAIFEILEEVDFRGWVVVELDGTPQAPRPPREAAAMSKHYLEALLGDRADW
jgi:inosose dehydratase